MVRYLIILTTVWILSLVSSSSSAAKNIWRHFKNSTMRIDYHHTGNAEKEFVSIDRIYRQGIWAGNPDGLIDPLDNGRYRIKVFAAGTDTLLYSKGFDCYFGEYKTTSMALGGIMKAFHESALIPYPKSTIELVIERRNRRGGFERIFSQNIDPRDVNIIQENLIQGVKVYKLHYNGSAHKKVDLVIVGEGYTQSQEAKFLVDLERTRDTLLAAKPFSDNRDKFNIYGVYLPSQESGCDDPRRGIFKNTSVGASFNSLGLDRYMLTENNRILRDIAAHVPYDTIMLLVNSDRYGGGGIYNLFAAFTADTIWHPYVVVHEFGHSFVGLADEYYTSAVAYNDAYPQGVEPPEPNITALSDSSRLKWASLVDKNTQIPTPWNKEAYDTLSISYQKTRNQLNEMIAELSRSKAPSDEIERIKQKEERLALDNSKKVDLLLSKDPAKGKVGAFLGAGYSSQGLYRPMTDCIMFTKGTKPFCKVCEAAVQRVIDHYTH